MIGEIFTTIIYQPFYNLFVFFVGVFPGENVGLAVVALTLAVKFAILPFTHKSMKTSATMKIVQPEIDKIKERHKNDQKEQAAHIMNLYKKHGINPFSSCLFSFVQIPIIIGLYWVFWKGFAGGIIHTDILYSFVSPPESVNLSFLGFFDLGTRSIFLSLLAGVTQFLQMHLAFPKSKKDERKELGEKSFSEEMKKSFAFQARYVLPIVIVVASLGFSAAVPLYWSTSNLFSVVHELLVRRKAARLVSAGDILHAT